MELTFRLELPEDFRMLCDIFGHQPEKVLQRFTEEVSFPIFFADPHNNHRWATLFFLYNMGVTDDELADKWEEYEEYMDLMAKAALNDKKNAEEACRKVLRDWHHTIMRKRTNDLLKNLNGKDQM